MCPAMTGCWPFPGVTGATMAGAGGERAGAGGFGAGLDRHALPASGRAERGGLRLSGADPGAVAGMAWHAARSAAPLWCGLGRGGARGAAVAGIGAAYARGEI